MSENRRLEHCSLLIAFCSLFLTEMVFAGGHGSTRGYPILERAANRYNTARGAQLGSGMSMGRRSSIRSAPMYSGRHSYSPSFSSPSYYPYSSSRSYSSYPSYPSYPSAYSSRSYTQPSYSPQYIRSVTRPAPTVMQPQSCGSYIDGGMACPSSPIVSGPVYSHTSPSNYVRVNHSPVTPKSVSHSPPKTQKKDRVDRAPDKPKKVKKPALEDDVLYLTEKISMAGIPEDPPQGATHFYLMHEDGKLLYQWVRFPADLDRGYYIEDGIIYHEDDTEFEYHCEHCNMFIHPDDDYDTDHSRRIRLAP